MKNNKVVGLLAICLMLVCTSINTNVDTKVNAETFNLDINEDNSIDVLDVITLKNRIVSNNDIGTYTNLLFLKKYILGLSSNVTEPTTTEGVSTEPPQTEPPTPSYPWDGLALSDFPNYITMGYGGGNGMTVKKAWQVQQALNRIFDEGLYDEIYNRLDMSMVDWECELYGIDRQFSIDLGITQSLTSILTIDTTYYEDRDFTPGEDDAYGGLACNTFGYMQDCGSSSTAYIAILGHIQACTGRYYKMAMLVDYTKNHGFYLIATGTYDENGNELWYDGGTPEPMSFYLEGYPNAQIYYYN